MRRYAKERSARAESVRQLEKQIAKEIPRLTPSQRRKTALTFVLKAYKNLNG